MPAIYTFLQKRKLHESQHGFLMVFVAYVISAILLVMGSDMFYNITSAAEGINMQSNEETQPVINNELYNQQTAELPTKAQLLNPESVVDATSATDVMGSTEVSERADTVWFLGKSMDEETFNSITQQLGSNAKKDTKQSKDAVVKSEASQATGAFAGITGEEVEMLERIVQAEAGGEDMVGKILVANVIMNRVESGHFAKSIKGVIFQQKGGEFQFSPVKDKRYWSVRISEDTQAAVKRALNGEDYSEGALYFVARDKTDARSMAWFDRKLDRLFKHGGHEFYKNK